MVSEAAQDDGLDRFPGLTAGFRVESAEGGGIVATASTDEALDSLIYEIAAI